MIVYFILFLVLLFAVIFVVEYFRQRRNASDGQEIGGLVDSTPVHGDQDFVCCGKHNDCEMRTGGKDFLPTIEYYEDEELDAFAGRTANSYKEEETALFREVLDTMRPEEIEGWLFSLRLREIVLPPSLTKEVADKKK